MQSSAFSVLISLSLMIAVQVFETVHADAIQECTNRAVRTADEVKGVSRDHIREFPYSRASYSGGNLYHTPDHGAHPRHAELFELDIMNRILSDAGFGEVVLNQENLGAYSVNVDRVTEQWLNEIKKYWLCSIILLKYDKIDCYQ